MINALIDASCDVNEPCQQQSSHSSGTTNESQYIASIYTNSNKTESTTLLTLILQWAASLSTLKHTSTAGKPPLYAANTDQQPSDTLKKLWVRVAEVLIQAGLTALVNIW